MSHGGLLLRYSDNINFIDNIQNFMIKTLGARYFPGLMETVHIESITCQFCLSIKVKGAVGWGTALQAGRSQVRFPLVSLAFFRWHNACSCTMDVGSAQPLRDLSIRNIFWRVKGGSAQGWQTCRFYVSIVLKSGSLNLMEPSGPVIGLYGDCLPYKNEILCHTV